MNAEKPQQQARTQEFDYKKLLEQTPRISVVDRKDSSGSLFQLKIEVPRDIVEDEAAGGRYASLTKMVRNTVESTTKSLGLAKDELASEMHYETTTGDKVLLALDAARQDKGFSDREKHGIAQAALNILGHMTLLQQEFPEIRGAGETE